MEQKVSTQQTLSTADSSAQIVGANKEKNTEYQDLGSVSTAGSNTGGSTDGSDTESSGYMHAEVGTGEVSTAASNTGGSTNVSETKPTADPAELEASRKESCLNKWTPPFVLGAPIKLSSTDVPSVANANGSAEIEVCATVSGALKLISATREQAVHSAKYRNDPKDFPALPIGIRPPPGLGQEPLQIDKLKHPLPPGLMLQAHIGVPKIPEPVYTEENKLRSDLNKLTQFDPACIFMVKKINKLGLNSAEFLKAYFARFGKVKCVLASHTVEKPNSCRPKPRVRPAGLAFVVMDKPEDVAKILRFRSEHIVRNVSILASQYEHHERWNPGRSEPMNLSMSDL